MKKIFLNLFFASLVFISCSNTPKGNVQIKGNIINGNNVKIYLDELSAASIKTRDSITLGASGEFNFSFNIEQIGFYRLRIDNSNFALLLLDKNDKIEFNSDAKKFALTYMVRGAANCEKIAQVNHLLMRTYIVTDSLKSVFNYYKETPMADSVGRSLDFQYQQLKLNEKIFLRKFIDENTESLASLSVIDQLNKEEDLSYFVKLDKVLFAKFPNSDYVKMFHARVAEMNQLTIGSEAPEISLNTPEGKTISLSSYRGRVVLVDFWASWCRPCRGENPNVVKAYNKYHDKGFDVLGVSLDRDKDAWKKAIAEDHLTWNHISDLKMWNSSVVKLYNISGIPFSVLLDKEGKIVAKGLRGEELEKEIEKLLR